MKLTIFDWMQAIAAGCSSSYDTYDTVEAYYVEDDKKTHPNNNILLSHNVSPEKVVIVNDLYTRLSEDARWLLEIIYDNPECFMSAKTCVVSKSGLQKRLKAIHNWSADRTRGVFNEVINFLSDVKEMRY
jgi:hypothetical protein